MMKLSTPEGLNAQSKLVLEYLQGGRSLTPMIAMVSLGIGSLTSRVAELRKAGVEISDSWEKDHFQRRYKTYWLGTDRPKEEAEEQDLKDRPGVHD